VAALLSWSWLLLGVLVIIFAFCFCIHFWLPWLLVAFLAGILTAVAWCNRGCGPRFLARAYHALNPAKLKGICQSPRFIFCSTDVIFGVLWSMTRGDVGDYQVGYAPTPDSFNVADAVAASSCFPPVFFPTPMRPNNLDYKKGKYQPDEKRKEWARKICLTDGGVYDNLGLEPLWQTDGAQILVCDGGGPLPVVSQKLVISLIQRYTSIIQNQALALRKRMLIDKFDRKVMTGTYWGMASAVERYLIGTQSAVSPFQGYSEAFVEKWIAPIRTDLAYFSPEEVGILMNHGYTLAEAAIQTHCQELIKTQSPFKAPFPGLMAESTAQEYLKDSHKLFVFSRLPQSWRGRQWYLDKLDSYTR